MLRSGAIRVVPCGGQVVHQDRRRRQSGEQLEHRELLQTSKLISTEKTFEIGESFFHDYFKHADRLLLCSSLAWLGFNSGLHSAVYDRDAGNGLPHAEHDVQVGSITNRKACFFTSEFSTMTEFLYLLSYPVIANLARSYRKREVVPKRSNAEQQVRSRVLLLP